MSASDRSPRRYSMIEVPSSARRMLSKVPTSKVAPAATARSRNHASNGPRSTMPTKPPSIGMSTRRSVGDTIRALVTRATNNDSGIANSLMSCGGMAPPHGLIRRDPSNSNTERPRRASSVAAVAPAGPPPTTTVSYTRIMLRHPLRSASSRTAATPVPALRDQRVSRDRYSMPAHRRPETTALPRQKPPHMRHRSNRSARA